MRQKFKSGTEYPLAIAPGVGDTTRNHGSEKSFEMRKAKRGRFDNSEADGIPVHASPRRHEATQSPRFGTAKTSEYAYFRKVKKGAVHGNSSSVHEENEQLKSSKVKYLTGESINASDMPKPSMEDFGFSASRERARPSDHHLFLSPCVSKYDKPEQRSKELTNRIKKRSPLLSKNIMPIGKSPSPSQLDNALQNSDNQSIEKEIFSAKRHRLCQWAAHATISEAEMPHPKGFDLVSSLPSRQFPKGNENNDSPNDDMDNSIKPHNFGNLDKGLHLAHKRDWDKNLPKICSGRSSEIVLSEWDTFFSGFPFPYYDMESHAYDEQIDLGSRSKSDICKSFPAQHEFSFCLPFERYRSSGSSYFKELDEFGSVTEHAREAPNRLLLEWDFEGEKDRVDSFIINQDATTNVYPGLGTSWNIDKQSIADDLVDCRGLYSASLPSNYYLEFNSLPSYDSTSYLTQDFRPYVDDLKYAMAEPRQFSLALPFTLPEYRKTENMHYDSNIIFSCEDQHWFNKVSDHKPQSDLWWEFLSTKADPPSNFHAWHFPKKSLHSFSGAEDDTGEPFTRLSQGTFNNRFFSNFQSSLDTFINPHLLLDHVSHNMSKQEYFDDNNDGNDSLYG